MNRRRIQFSLRIALAFVMIAAMLAFWFRPRYVNVEFAISEYAEVESPTNGPSLTAHVRVTNRSPNALWYQASSRESPDVFYMERVKDEWQLSGQSFEPKEWQKLARGESLVIEVPLYDDAQAIKIGLDFYAKRNGKPSNVWSDEFTVHRPRERQ